MKNVSIKNESAYLDSGRGSTAYIDAQNQIRFVPDSNYHGSASFTYWVSDGAGLETPATVNLTVLGVNDAPVAVADSVNGTEDITLQIAATSLLGNDTDVDVATDGQVLTIQSVSGATHGTVSLVTLANGQQQINFVPDANYNGQAQFSYTITDGNGGSSTAVATLNIAAVNDLPVAVGETVNTNEDTTLLFNPSQLLANDSDVDVATNGQVLTISAVSNAQRGAVSILANGQIQFVPELNYNGVASFDYTVSDGAGGTRVATTTVNLAAVNDAPLAVGETVSGTEDTTLIITAATLLANDSDVDNVQSSLTLSRVQSGTGGTATLNANGTVSFVPTTNFNGTATFTYWVRDPAGLESNAVTTSILVAAVNDAPVAQGEIVTGAIEDAVFTIPKTSLLANDSDVDNANSQLSISLVAGTAVGGTVAINASGNVVFTPTANFNGNARFQYRVRDPDGLESAAVTAVIPVQAVNDAPVAVDDQFTTYKNSTMTINYNQLTSNDSDVDGDALTVSGVRNATNGVVSIVNGKVQFVPTAGFKGTASFQYRADDSNGGQTWATAQVRVTEPPNAYPTATITGLGINWYNSAYHEVNNASFSFRLNDDTNPAGVSMWFGAATYVTGIDWEASQGISWGRSGATGYINMAAGYYQVDDNGNYGWGPVAYFNYAYTTWYLRDEQGLYNTMYLNVDYTSSNYTLGFANYGNYYAPVVMDLNGDGVRFKSVQDSSVLLDANNDGIADKLAWADNNDGVLVWDKDGNQQMTDATEIGFQTLKARA